MILYETSTKFNMVSDTSGQCCMVFLHVSIHRRIVTVTVSMEQTNWLITNRMEGREKGNVSVINKYFRNFPNIF
jgi:hypothetical protein